MCFRYTLRVSKSNLFSGKHPASDIVPVQNMTLGGNYKYNATDGSKLSSSVGSCTTCFVCVLRVRTHQDYFFLPDQTFAIDRCSECRHPCLCGYCEQERGGGRSGNKGASHNSESGTVVIRGVLTTVTSNMCPL